MSVVTRSDLARPTAAGAPERVGGSSAAHALLDVLAGWGVQRMYCCPGSTEVSLLDALVTRDDVRLVLVTHESVAVSMAEGEARATGRPAVAYVHTSVGMANAVAHLSSAQLAYAPVVVLNGLKASTLAGRLAFTAADPREMVGPFVKWAHIVAASQLLPVDVDRALHVATTEPAGPVWLGLPQDLLEAGSSVAEPSRSRLAGTSSVRPSDPALAAAAVLLASAERPVLVAGADVVRRSASDAVTALADRLDAPVFEESRRDFLASVLSSDHPRRVGRLDQVSDSLGDADVVAYLGCRMFTEFEKPHVPRPSPAARTIHLHSDPAEVGRLHTVDVGLVGDPGMTISALLDLLPPHAVTSTPRSYGAAPTAAAGPIPGHRDLRVAVDALAAAVTASDATVVLDATTATGALLDGLRTTRPGQLVSSTSGSLGWGMGASLGVSLGNPSVPVVCVVGDGAFQFGLPALWAAQQLDASVTFVVLNNGLYAAVASALGRFDGQAAARDVWPGTDIRGLDISAAAAAFGIPSQRFRATDLGLPDALRQAVGAPGPALVEVLTHDPEPAR